MSNGDEEKSHRPIATGPFSFKQGTTELLALLAAIGIFFSLIYQFSFWRFFGINYFEFAATGDVLVRSVEGLANIILYSIFAFMLYVEAKAAVRKFNPALHDWSPPDTYGFYYKILIGSILIGLVSFFFLSIFIGLDWIFSLIAVFTVPAACPIGRFFELKFRIRNPVFAFVLALCVVTIIPAAYVFGHLKAKGTYDKTNTRAMISDPVLLQDEKYVGMLGDHYFFVSGQGAITVVPSHRMLQIKIDQD